MGPRVRPDVKECAVVSTPQPEQGRRPGRQGKKALVALVLAWALPGLGHVYIGRYGRGLLIMVLLVSTFTLGVAMKAPLFVPFRHVAEPVEAHAGLISWTGPILDAAQGIPFFAALAIRHSSGTVDGVLAARFFDVGVTFTLVSGLLNLLVILDAWELARGTKWLPAPHETAPAR